MGAKREREEEPVEEPAEPSILTQSAGMSFPRGGGSVLTPLEIKEVSNEAARDVLFEQESSSKRRKKGKKIAAEHNNGVEDEDRITVDHLDYKLLEPGAVVLGQIVSVGRMELVLSLADNIDGFVPITNVSKEVSDLIAEYEGQDESESDSEAEDEAEETDDKLRISSTSTKKFPTLKERFHEGQWLRAVVTDNTSSTGRKRIELSIEPEKVAEGVEKADVTAKGAIVQCSVASVEDHGAILNVGQPKLSGFINKKSLKAAGFPVDTLAVGSVFLLAVQKSTGRVLACDFPQGADSEEQPHVLSVETVEGILPGMLADAIVLDVTEQGITCQVNNLCKGSINYTHLGLYDGEKIKDTYPLGSTLRGRVLATYTKEGEKKVQLSMLPHLVTLAKQTYDPETESSPLDAFPIGSIFDSATVQGSDSRYVFLNVGNRSTVGQCHKSRITSTDKFPTDFPTGSQHSARVLGYCNVDNVYILTLDAKEIEKKYLRIEDVPIGQKVECVVQKINPGKGINVMFDDHFHAFVPLEHLSDIRLVYPERKFKVGSKVKGRVLRVTNRGPRSNIYVTLKKSFVRAADDEVLSSIEDAQVGKHAPATISKMLPGGCVVRFFGFLKGYLPKSEISETFVKRPEDHLKLGQTVRVRLTDVDKVQENVRVSMRVSGTLSSDQEAAMEKLVPGKSIVSVQVAEREKNSLVVELVGSQIRGIIPFGQVADGNYEQDRVAMKKIAVGSTADALVLSKNHKERFVNLTLKPSMIADSKSGALPSNYRDISVSNKLLHGFVKNVNSFGVFVGFADNLTGLMPPQHCSEDFSQKSYFAGQTVPCRIIATDDANKRFLVSSHGLSTDSTASEGAESPVDESIQTIGEFVPGKKTKAKIVAVKPTLLSVELAANVAGRVDISEVYDGYSDIKDHKHPLAPFKKGDVIDVRVIGYHDKRNDAFNTEVRKIKGAVIELTMKHSQMHGKVVSPALKSYSEGQYVTAFVSNFATGFLWVVVTPRVRGKVSLAELPEGKAKDIQKKYPIGSALELGVISVDDEQNFLKLGAYDPAKDTKSDEVSVGRVFPATVLNVKSPYVNLELSNGGNAISYITDALDNYTRKLDEVYTPGDEVSAKVVEVSPSENKVYVSLRSSDPSDKSIASEDSIKRGDVLRGFVKSIADNGIYVALSRHLYALVRVSDLSDSFLRDWKQFFQPNQVVVGKILRADGPGKIQMTLKASEVNSDSDILKRYDDIEVGDIYEGSVKKVTDFGVFIKLNGTVNVTGLCHQSEIADHPVKDVASIFGEGDRVKVKVLRKNPGKKQVSLGMKASYFNEDAEDNDNDDDDMDVDEEASSPEEAEESDSDKDEDEVMESGFAEESDDDDEKGLHNSSVYADAANSDDSDDDEEEDGLTANEGLSTGFDWTASVLEQANQNISDDEDDEDEYDSKLRKKKSKRSKKQAAEIEDKTAELSTKAPESVQDFERLIVGNPDSSLIWIQYMSFELQLGEIDKAREIGQRALKTINYRDEQDKLNVWIALLNLESMFGTDESLDKTFKEACQYMDPYVVYQKLVSIFTSSEKFDKAQELYGKMCKKFGYEHVPVWVAYGSFLLDRDEAEEAHKTLAKALQVLPKRDHVDVVRKFAQLEFKKGDPEQGRSLFEGLLSDLPKRLDLWNVYIDQEIKNGDAKNVEDLFERAITKKLTKKQAKFFFGKWLEYEEQKGDQKAADYVKAKAAEYAQALAEKQP